ncbi:MAG: hypothetical protein A2289_21180 [Deltaproteobacteria bacterium RIFOXYA12_FULL_58_15]|nr:MAG: hypothetical protein A2289_21180 [Deltaproteobacteria bacterium RIFOXYA12_FULL_58_15]OGR08718.1 MAG: hypothetical protein A2341_00790 [Deltaproteobacteria bacterium RIFOXYB12_FULL_58_9]
MRCISTCSAQEVGTVGLIDRRTHSDVGLKRRPINIGTATFVEKAHAGAALTAQVFPADIGVAARIA